MLSWRHGGFKQASRTVSAVKNQNFSIKKSMVCNVRCTSLSWKKQTNLDKNIPISWSITDQNIFSWSTWHFFMIKDFISSFNNGVKILISSVLKFSQFGVWKTRLITFCSFFFSFICWKSSRVLRSSPDGKLKWNTSTWWSSYTQKEYACRSLEQVFFFSLIPI